jgi:hypothetical protein
METEAQEFIEGLVNSRAKAVVSRGIDFTLLIGLLVMQYLRCEAPSIDIEDPDPKDALFSCDPDNLPIMSWEIAASWEIVTGVLAISYGLVSSATVWAHASCRFRKLGGNVQPTNIENIYGCTDRIIIIDSIVEIPISFLHAPIMTVFLYSLFLAFCAGLYVTALDFKSKVQDSNAASVFITSSFLVVLSLLKLTGEISQYWVIYKEIRNEKEEADFSSSPSRFHAPPSTPPLTPPSTPSSRQHTDPDPESIPLESDPVASYTNQLPSPDSMTCAFPVAIVEEEDAVLTSHI